MIKDDRVVVPFMPHLGTGVVDLVVPEPFNRVVVRFRIDGKPYLEDFAPGELEPAKPLVARTA